MAVDEGEQLAAGLTEAILGAVADGISVQDAHGRLVYANDAAARLSGFESAAALLAAEPGDIIGRFELLDEHHRPMTAADLPGRLALAERREHSALVCWRIRGAGEERWSNIRAIPIEAHGAQFAVNVFRDVTERKRADDQLRLLSDASELFVSSLDVELTLGAIGTMLVPSFADYCLIDLLEEDGTLRHVIQRHADPKREAILRELRERYPPDGNPEHPATVALSSAEPVLIELTTEDDLRRAALDESHFQLYSALEPTSYLVVPLIARSRTIGAISLGMGESGRRYGTADIAFAQALAGRIALAVENARLYENARSSYALLNTLLVSAPVGIGFMNRDLRFVRVNDALAQINGIPAAEHPGLTLADVKPELADTLEPMYRSVLETGEPVAHSESTDELGMRLGDRRHWVSSYYPVRTADGEVTGVGAVIMDVTAERWAVERLKLLAGAGALFSSSLDVDDVFARVARVIVPQLADSLHIFLAAPDGTELRRVSCAHVDPELVPVLESLPDSYPLGPDSPAFMATVYERSEPVLFADVSQDFYEHLAELGADREALQRIGSRSMMLVPLVARGQTLGVLAVGSREVGRYSEEDMALTLEVAGRASVAIDNARLFREVSFRTTLLEAQQEASIDGLLVVSPGGELVSYNRRFAELWDFPDELLAAGSDARALEVAMERVVDPEEFMARVQYLYDHPEETSTEEVALKDGRVLDRYGAAVRSTSGEYYGWLWSFRDVTEARRAAHELERRAQVAQALEFVGDGVFLVDGAGVVRLWNPAAAAITGVAEADIVGRPLVEALPRWADLQQLVPVARTPSQAVRAETIPVDTGGRELWLSISGVSFAGGTVYAFRDLTDERAVDRLKSDFVSTVSHELRTPLAAIYGAAMTLRRVDVPLSPVQRDGMLDVVSGESERLARIVNDILLASRLDSDVVDVSIGQADAAELARMVVAAAAAHLPPGITLRLTAPDDLPPIAADDDKLRQVLVNLVENAIKYSPDGGPVEVELAEVDGRMRFSIRDQGLGIPASEHRRIFDKFYRLDPNLTRGVGGTGLGLYICREIVRRMHGRIWVESQPGRGSTFHFELPLA